MFSKAFAAAILAVSAQADTKYFYANWRNQRGVYHTNIGIGSQQTQGGEVVIDFEADRLGRSLRGNSFQLDFHELDSGRDTDWDSRTCAPKSG